MEYDYSLEHVETLRKHASDKNMSIPDGFEHTPTEQLQECYNGIGPDRWSSKFRGTMTYALSFLESSALIHDWEFTYQPKTYGAFTVANLRLAYNAAKDRHPVAGVAAAVLCQLFGWRGFREGDGDAGSRIFPKPPSGLSVCVCRKPVLACGFAWGSLLSLALTGCLSDSEDHIREYDAAGILIREETRSESPVKSILASVKEKTIILWDNSWIAFISASSFSLEDPAPVLKMGIGHADKGYISLLPQHDFSSVPETVRAVRDGSLSLSASGIDMSRPGSAAEEERNKK